jgi:regulator of sirC expression with transglutaminase-like and TPR domain
VGRRLQVSVDGIGFPGHFMVRYQDEAGAWLLDPFHGKVVVVDGVVDYLSQLFGQAVLLPPEVYRPVTMRVLAQRILYNLRNVYLGRRDFVMAARVMDYLLVIAPNDAVLWQERGLLYHQGDDWEQAARDLRRYFFLSGKLSVLLPTTNETLSASADLSQRDQEMLSILRQIEQIRTRIN